MIMSSPAPGTPDTRSGRLAEGDPDALDRLRVVLLRVSRRIRSSSTDIVPASQRVVLGSLAQAGELTVTEIADMEQIKLPSASKTVTALAERGYVERRRDSHDLRRTVVVPTPEGLEVIESIREAGRNWLAQQLAECDAGDLAQLEASISILERLLSSAE